MVINWIYNSLMTNSSRPASKCGYMEFQVDWGENIVIISIQGDSLYTLYYLMFNCEWNSERQIQIIIVRNNKKLLMANYSVVMKGCILTWISIAL